MIWTTINMNNWLLWSTLQDFHVGRDKPSCGPSSLQRLRRTRTEWYSTVIQPNIYAETYSRKLQKSRENKGDSSARMILLADTSPRTFLDYNWLQVLHIGRIRSESCKGKNSWEGKQLEYFGYCLRIWFGVIGHRMGGQLHREGSNRHIPEEYNFLRLQTCKPCGRLQLYTKLAWPS